MDDEPTKSIRVDLNQFKLHLRLKPGEDLTLHFNTPSRRFYLSVIGLVVSEMQKQGKLALVPLQKHLNVLKLLNETVGGSAGSSQKEHLLPRIYMKWKDALPDLENAPLFKVVGRKKRSNEEMGRGYAFSEGEKDSWANLFEYKGSHENVRLRFSIDRIGAMLDDVAIVFGKTPMPENLDAWEGFVASLREDQHDLEHIDAGPKVSRRQPPNLMRRLRAMTTRQKLAGLMTGLIIGGGIVFGVWKANLFAPQIEIASIEKMALPLPEQPSIAVLPFRNISDDPKQEYFSDGLTEDIITALSKIGSMFVIASNTTFTYKGHPVKINQVAEDLGVRYILEGSVRKAGDRLRITAQLIDALKGHHLWAERYDRDLKDIFVIQDDITKKIITALDVKLTGDQHTYAYAKSTDNLEAYLKLLQIRALNDHSDTMESNVLIRQLAAETIALDPNCAFAYSWLGWTHLNDIYYGMTKDFTNSWQTAFDLGRKAQSLDEKTALSLMGSLYQLKGQFDKGVAEADRFVEFFPNGARAHFHLGRFLMNADRAEEAIPLFKKVLRLDPYASAPRFYCLGFAYWMIGLYEEAIAICNKGLQRNPDDWFTHMALAVSYLETGNLEVARRSAAEILRINPKASLAWFEKIIHWKNKEIKARLIDDLRLAGLT